jgi:hypothetical protein
LLFYIVPEYCNIKHSVVTSSDLDRLSNSLQIALFVYEHPDEPVPANLKAPEILVPHVLKRIRELIVILKYYSDKQAQVVNDEVEGKYSCPHCGSDLTKEIHDWTKKN